jgi:HEAT repeat protein
MIRTIAGLACLAEALLIVVATSWGQDAKPSAAEQEQKLIAVLKSNASQKEKADACRELALKGTKAAVAPLAALLGDEHLGHMARYALEPIPDLAVDDALRDALEKLEGRLKVGVIGSIGVRRDAKAVDSLIKLLKDKDREVARAAARALGRFATPAAAKALEDALAGTPAADQLALYEGLFRCAEGLSAHGQRADALAIYDRLSAPEAPPQVREAASRKARTLRQEHGPTLSMARTLRIAAHAHDPS